jgi:zinc protease
MKRSVALLVLVCVLLSGCVIANPAPVTSPALPTIMPAPSAPSATPVAPATVVTATGRITATAPLTATNGITATASITATGPISDTTPQRVWQPGDTLPVDPRVHTGVLANGLTYILRQNSQPKNRAELRLVVNAGSVMEADDQKGLAHLLEHMLFDGTCHFPKQGITDFLQSNGMRDGADLNAATGFDDTTYILRIPLDDPKVLDTGLNVLVDWASCATLDPTEVNRERGVIVEEHRVRDLNAQGRIDDQLYPALLAGSQYAQRLPIGDMNIVQNAPVDTLRRFYTTWYRPDLMVVVGVGDFDVTQVEQMLRAKFSAIPARKDALPRPTIKVPDFAGTRTLVASDPENPITFVQLYAKRPPQVWGSVSLYRQVLVRDLFFNMLNGRYADLIKAGNAPFSAADAGPNDIVRTLSSDVVEAQTTETNTLPALDTLMTEVERVRRFGFTMTELTQAKNILLEGYRSAFSNRNTADTSSLVEEYIRHYLTGEDIPGIAVEYQLANQLVPQITLQEVNQAVQSVTGADNRLLFAVTPQKAGLTPPTEAQLTAVLNQVAAKQLAPLAEQALPTQLMTVIPQPGALVSQTSISALGVTVLKLANGVTVQMKPTTFKTDEVLFSGVGRGGSSLLPDADVPAARLAGAIVGNSGVGQLSSIELGQLLNGKSVSVSPSIRELSQRFDGSAAPRDLETALQLLYLYVTQPKLDANTVKAVKDAAAADLANRGLDPQSALQDTLTRLEYGNSVRWNPVLPLAAIQGLDANRAFQIYKERFADMSGFTFTFVGNFDVAQLTGLAQRYLGTLPGKGGVSAWRDFMPPVPEGVQQQDVYKGSGDLAEAQIVFMGAFGATPDEQIQLKMIRDVLRIRLTAELRQKLSATYSPSASTRVDLWPQTRYALGIDFTDQPTRTKELLTATFAQIADLRANGPTATELATAKEQEKRSHEGELTQNGYWLSLLTSYGIDPQQDPGLALGLDASIDKVTAADLQAAARQFLKPDQYVQVVLYPAAMQPPPASGQARVVR